MAEKDRSYREWMMVAVGLTGLLSVLAIIVSVVALSSKNPTSTTATVAVPAAATVAKPAAAPEATSVRLLVKADDEHGRKGPDGQWHDAFLPADFSVQAGAVVHVTVVNYDGGPHTFTAPALGLNATIPGGGSLDNPKISTFTFTAPKNAGKFAWWCAVPCDPWAMAHDGFMRGYVTVKA
jgi:hypothetical protein